MPSATAIRTESPARSFPTAEVGRRLQKELKKAAEESVVLKGGWEPEIDSLRMVSVILVLEDLFDFRLPPEKLVCPGGCASIEEANAYISNCLKRLWKKEYEK